MMTPPYPNTSDNSQQNLNTIREDALAQMYNDEDVGTKLMSPEYADLHKRFPPGDIQPH